MSRVYGSFLLAVCPISTSPSTFMNNLSIFPTATSSAELQARSYKRCSSPLSVTKRSGKAFLVAVFPEQALSLTQCGPKLFV
jgi:hypothetical protein